MLSVDRFAEPMGDAIADHAGLREDFKFGDR